MTIQLNETNNGRTQEDHVTGQLTLPTTSTSSRSSNDSSVSTGDLCGGIHAASGRNPNRRPAPRIRAFLGHRAAPGLFCALILATAPAFGDTVLRTIAYHQITAMTNDGAPLSYAVAGNHSLMLSADSRKIVYTRTWSVSPVSNFLYTVNFDGSGLTLADAFPAPCYCSVDVDISADGSRIIGFNGGLIRMANSDGSNPHQVLYVNSGFQDCRISPDGATVYFSVDRGFGTSPDTGSHEAGLYAVNADGTGFRPVAGLTSFASFFGTTPGALIPGGYMYAWNGGSPFALSGDGTKLVCFVWTPTPTNRYALLGLNADGTGLHELPLGGQAISLPRKLALNGDGSKVGYYFNCPSGEELGVINWDGTGRRVLLSTCPGGGGLAISLLTMNWDGSKLLCGDTGDLFNTDGSGRLAMAWNARFAPNNVFQWGFYHAVMDANGTRFTYLTPAGANDGARLQIGTAELNPASLGLAPTISGASATPPYITTNGPSPIFALQPTPTNGLVANGGAQAGILLDGIADPSTWQGSSLHDNGAGGDAVSGDGVYSDNTGYFFNVPTLGPRTLRFKAELLGADEKYHATAIDTAPFFVVGQVPTNPPPTVTSISPSNAPAGSVVTITGSGFDPNATNNVLLFGNVPGVVVSGNPTGTELIVVVPGGLPAGPVAVTVTAFGQTSSGAAFTVISPMLSVWLTGTNTVVVSWPAPSTGWNLEQNTDLNAVNWVLPPEIVNNDGTNKFITVNPPVGDRFFRLHRAAD